MHLEDDRQDLIDSLHFPSIRAAGSTRVNGVESAPAEGLLDRVAVPAVTVVVPTKDEAPNIEPLVARVSEALTGFSSWEILFVDDSDDDTPEAVREAGRSAPVRLLHRQAGQRGQGLSGAVLAGFGEARGKVLAVMDADLQHPPELLPELLDPVLSGKADLVAGTRYSPSGAATGLSGPWRRTVSNGGRRLVHVLLQSSRCLSDPMSGLFACRREVIEGVTLRPNGFKILLEVVARGRVERVHNVSYHFAERQAGSSKACFAEGKRFFHHLMRLLLDSRDTRLAPASRSVITTSAAILAPAHPETAGSLSDSLSGSLSSPFADDSDAGDAAWAIA